ncbi:4'-phosphopantetheinyl transferase family protein [Marinobacterium aestuariivivens]|uniref:4'-phosphopantetheinyl transferase family protein n=1 Tax=Marinobacterium aestuariivivens TaxID=1698799 RepID=A0ABW1ZXJ7_9GAMM
MDPRNRDNISIWFANTGQFASLLARRPAAVFACISRAERARYEATVSRRARLQFLLGRYLLRHALCAQSGNTRLPAHWKIIADRHGKPGLCRRTTGTMAFNIAHSGDLVAVAFAQGLEPGLDIEPIAASGRFSARQLLSDAQHRHLTGFARARREALLAQVWCIKEAAAKAYGLGLRLPFRTLDFALASLDDRSLSVWQEGSRDGHDGFRFRLLELGERYRLCLAYVSSGQHPVASPGVSLYAFTPPDTTGPGLGAALATQL